MKENHYNCIYMYISPSGKMYIGKAIDFNKRYKTHIYASNNKNCKDYNVPFHNAIRKYGIENFKIKILAEDLKLEELGYWENYYIEKYNLYAKNGKGYNIANGGQGGNNFAGKTNEEMEEVKKHMRENHFDCTGKNHHQYGKPRTETEKNNISKGLNKAKENGTKIGRKGKKIYQFDKDMNLIKIWDIAMDIQRELNIDNSAIIKCCKGKRKTAGGYIWKYAEDRPV